LDDVARKQNTILKKKALVPKTGDGLGGDMDGCNASKGKARGKIGTTWWLFEVCQEMKRFGFCSRDLRTVPTTKGLLVASKN
jgi:hypothetical protein